MVTPTKNNVIKAIKETSLTTLEIIFHEKKQRK